MKWTCGRGYQLIGVGGVLGIEAVVESGNKRVDQTLLLDADLAGIELCGVHKEHRTHSQVEPKVEKVVPEKCAGVWPHKVEDACTEEGGGGMGGGGSAQRAGTSVLHSLPKTPNMMSSRGSTNLTGAHSTYSWNMAEMRMGGREAMRLYHWLWNSCRQRHTHTQRESGQRESG